MSARHLVPLLAVLCVAASCNQVPKRAGASVQARSSTSLEESSPIDVAVAPLVNSSGNAALPAAALRGAFQGALIKRRYTPLALGEVDKKVVDASYRPGALDEQAVLAVVVERWDTRLWDTRNVIEVTLAARMVDPGNPSGELWSGRLEQRFDFADVAERFTTSASLQKHACETIAAEVLAALPPRRPMPGPGLR